MLSGEPGSGIDRAADAPAGRDRGRDVAAGSWIRIGAHLPTSSSPEATP